MEWPNNIPANLFWDISVRFLSWECWDFWRRHDHIWRFPKKSEVFRRRPKSAEGEVIEKTLIYKIRDREEGIVIYSFTHGFRSLHGSELTYFWKLCQARRQQLTFFNQAWEIGPQAWASVRSKFSTRRRESWQVHECYLNHNQNHYYYHHHHHYYQTLLWSKITLAYLRSLWKSTEQYYYGLMGSSFPYSLRIIMGDSRPVVAPRRGLQKITWSSFCILLKLAQL